MYSCYCTTSVNCCNIYIYIYIYIYSKDDKIAEYAMLDIKAPQWHIRWLINWLNGGFWPETWRMVASVALHILPTLPETGEGMGAETSGSEKNASYWWRWSWSRRSFCVCIHISRQGWIVGPWSELFRGRHIHTKIWFAIAMCRLLRYCCFLPGGLGYADRASLLIYDVWNWWCGSSTLSRPMTRV